MVSTLPVSRALSAFPKAVFSAGITAAIAFAQIPAAPTSPAHMLAETKASAAPAESATPTPKPVLTTEMRGDISMARKDYRQAVDLYSEIEPKNAIIYNKIGIAYHQLADMNMARRFYERAVKTNPKYAEAVNNLGTVYYAQRSYRRAVGQYNRALKISPNSASIYSNLGTAWFARKNYQRAMENYHKALALDSEVFEHRSTSGVLLQERSVEERAKFHFYMAKLYAKAGIIDRALQYVRKSLEEGFTEPKKYLEEPEFAGLQQLPEFQELLATKPRVL
jgi:tetratricopeptide (TPR) repeat protein